MGFGLTPRPKPKTKINLGLDLEFISIHIDIEINKHLKFSRYFINAIEVFSCLFYFSMRS